jgi:hypothetical protein
LEENNPFFVPLDEDVDSVLQDLQGEGGRASYKKEGRVNELRNVRTTK